MAILGVLQPKVTTAYARKKYIVLSHVPKVRGQFGDAAPLVMPSLTCLGIGTRFAYGSSSFCLRPNGLSLANRHNQMAAIQDIFSIQILPFSFLLNFLLYMYHFSFELLIPHYVDSY